MRAVGARPHVIFRDRWRRQRPHVRPVEADPLLDRISLDLHGEMELAVSGLGRRLQAISSRVVEPAVVRAGDAALLDASVEQRGAPVDAMVRDEPGVAALVLE